ncbi:MAG: hypothetical protein H6901_00345 [Rhodobacteraceae bacterium]|nr:hypothetical protein [Paracoccaceae bacterium]MCP5340656.1 hypothetical protein [Paracoccaceae bacterium]
MLMTGASPGQVICFLGEVRELHVGVDVLATLLDGVLRRLALLVPAATLRADDFDSFYAGRKLALIKLVETAMGKRAQLDQSGAVLASEAAE